jgi:hypothetical protein
VLRLGIEGGWAARGQWGGVGECSHLGVDGSTNNRSSVAGNVLVGQARHFMIAAK